MAYRQTYGRQSHRNGYAATATGLADKLNNIHNQNKVNMEHIKTIALLVVIFALYAVVSNDDYNTTVLVNQAHMEAE